jgi:hypothetical protein
MNKRNWMQLLTVLIIASVLLVGAVQRFDTIIAKRIITTSSSGVQLNGAGTLSLASGGMTLASGDLNLTTGDATLTAGDLDVTAGNLSIGNGTPGVTLDGEDAYIEGTLEVDGLATFDGGTDYNAASSVLDADGDTIRTVGLNIITYTLGAAAGYIDIATGNLKVGDGTPTFTQDGEDAYIEGLVEFGSDFVSGAQTTFTVDFAFPITPTGLYQPLDSADLGNGDGAAVTDIAAPTDDTIGKQLILHNINASQVITIDGTGATVECKTDVIMGAGDTLILLWNGDDWNCLSSYDNS